MPPMAGDMPPALPPARATGAAACGFVAPGPPGTLRPGPPEVAPGPFDPPKPPAPPKPSAPPRPPAPPGDPPPVYPAVVVDEGSDGLGCPPAVFVAPGTAEPGVGCDDAG